MRNSKRLPLYIAGGATVSALAVTGGILASTQSAPAKPTVGSSTPTSIVQSRPTGLGQILVDGQGRSVYLFAKDTGDVASCTGACASFWPPVPAAAVVQAGGGTSATDIGTIASPGGGRQLSYAGHPLYYFIGDHHAGDTTGQALDQFGALWYALAPNGTAVTQPAANSGTGGGGVGGY